MTDIIRRHVSQYPHARTSTIQYLAKRDAMTERLRQEATISYQREAANRLPKRRWSLLAWILGRM